MTEKTCSKCGKGYPNEAALCLEDGFPLIAISVSAQDLKIGPRYVVEGELGRGGMGAIFKARHIAMDRLVAIKLLLADISEDPEAMMRFQVEARAASILSHPNIIKIFEFDFTEGGMPYLVMEYLEGVTLDESLRRHNRLPYEVALPIFIEICAALSHAHQRNVVHRDLKPSNIMVVKDDDGRYHPMLLDFGIAKLFTAQGKTSMRLTQTGEVFGSPMYMSPEQCMGQQIDARSDIYSFGCVMYETLTGIPPIQGQNFLALVYAHLHDEPYPFSKILSQSVPPSELEAIVFKALRKAPDERYSSIKELQKALEDFLGKKQKATTSTPIVESETTASEKSDGRKADDRKVEDRKVEDRRSEDRKSEDRKAEDLKAEDRKFEDRKYETPQEDETSWNPASIEEHAEKEDEGMDELHRKAESGDVNAQYELGYMYNEGQMMERDLEKALYWHQRAAEQNFVESMCSLGFLYLNGELGEPDHLLSLHYFQEAANLGHAQSQSCVGDCYEFGRAVTQDNDLAFYWHKKSAEGNHAISMGILGNYYENGTGVEPNVSEAAKWYLKGAEKGDRISQNRIGLMYAEGKGVKQDAEEAASWYLCAAQQGLDEAKVNLALCYQDGVGVPMDENEALMWMQYAADAGHPQAQNWIAYWYQKGLMGLEQDFRLAFRWYTKAALKKDSWAQYQLGTFCEHGEGVPKNAKQAFEWYKKSAEQGEGEAELSVARCFLHGIGTTKDDKQFVSWMEKAADRGIIDALYELGLYYDEEKKDWDEASSWYSQAAALGDERAQERLLQSEGAK